MSQTTIRLVTFDDMRAIDSRNLDAIPLLPFFYIATADPDVMRVWGVAQETQISDTERLYPGTLVVPRYAGETVSRADLLYHGAEPAAAFVSLC